jgi:hypothetical protein
MSLFTNVLSYCIVLPKGLVLFIWSLLIFLCHFGWDFFSCSDLWTRPVWQFLLTIFSMSQHFVGDCLRLFQLYFYIWACFWSCRIAKSAVIFVSFQLPFYHLPLMYIPSCYLLHCNMSCQLAYLSYFVKTATLIFCFNNLTLIESWWIINSHNPLCTSLSSFPLAAQKHQSD